jgi:hypothetical protein
VVTDSELERNEKREKVVYKLVRREKITERRKNGE